MDSAHPEFATFRLRRTAITERLGDLRRLAGEIGAHQSERVIADELIAKLQEQSFNLVVMGEFNHGKSSFVNALLGAPILPTGVTPTTAILHHIRYGDAPRSELEQSDGSKTPLALDQLGDWHATGAGMTSEKPTPKAIQIAYPAAWLKEGVSLIDTPGVNDLSLQRADITYSYVPKSDAVVFLMDAGQLLKESERRFLMDKLVAQSKDKVVFVVNKIDQLSEEERDEALAYLQNGLAALLPNPTIFPVSAEWALAGRYEDSGIGPLLSYLSRTLIERRGKIILEHAIQGGLRHCGLLRKGVQTRLLAGQMSLEELERRIEVLKADLSVRSEAIGERRLEIRAEIGIIQQWAQRDLERFIEEMKAGLPEVVEEAESKDLRKYLGAYLEGAFQKWMSNESEVIAEALGKLAERTIALVEQNAAETNAKLQSDFALQAPEFEVSTFGYDVGVFALLTLGVGAFFTNVLLGGVLTLAAPLLAIYARGKADRKTKERALELAPLALDDAAAKAGPKMAALIGEFGEKLDAWLVEASAELFRNILQILEKTKEERQAKEADEAEEKLRWESLLGAVTQAESGLVELQRQFGLKAADCGDS